jgi:hypothetical protein
MEVQSHHSFHNHFGSLRLCDSTRSILETIVLHNTIVEADIEVRMARFVLPGLSLTFVFQCVIAKTHIVLNKFAVFLQFGY